MDEPGPGDRVIGPQLIIDESASRPIWSRGLDWILSAGIWALYIYFIRDALFELAILADEAFVWLFADAGRPHNPAISAALGTLRNYALVVATLGSAFVIWALYNQLRFRGNDRHGECAPVEPADLAALYGATVDDVSRWQAEPLLYMRHASDGTLIEVTTCGPRPRSPRAGSSSLP